MGWMTKTLYTLAVGCVETIEKTMYLPKKNHKKNHNSRIEGCGVEVSAMPDRPDGM